MGQDQGQSHHNTWLPELKLIVKGIGTRYKKPVQRGPPRQQLRPRRAPGVGHNGGCPEGKSYWVLGCESTLRHPDNYTVLSPKGGERSLHPGMPIHQAFLDPCGVGRGPREMFSRTMYGIKIQVKVKWINLEQNKNSLSFLHCSENSFHTYNEGKCPGEQARLVPLVKTSKLSWV